MTCEPGMEEVSAWMRSTNSQLPRWDRGPRKLATIDGENKPVFHSLPPFVCKSVSGDDVTGSHRFSGSP